MMDEEIRQALSEVREMKQMCGNINMKLTNIVTQRGQNWKEKLEAEYQRGFKDGKKEAESSEAIEQAKADAYNKGILFKEEKIHDAYQRGLEDGKKAFDLLDAERDSEYQRGLDDAWEAAKKIALMDTETSENVTGYFGLFRIMENLTPMQALEKLKAYEEKQKADDKIKVGDVVMIKQFKHPENHLFVVTKVSDESVWGVEGDGSWNYWAINEVIKTDKHFDIVSILEEMRHD